MFFPKQPGQAAVSDADTPGILLEIMAATWFGHRGTGGNMQLLWRRETFLELAAGQSPPPGGRPVSGDVTPSEGTPVRR